MNADVTSKETMRDIQGDLVLVHRPHSNCILTFVRVISPEGHTLRLVNRADKSRKPDWLVSQGLLDAMHPAPAKSGAKWEVRLKN